MPMLDSEYSCLMACPDVRFVCDLTTLPLLLPALLRLPRLAEDAVLDGTCAPTAVAFTPAACFFLGDGGATMPLLDPPVALAVRSINATSQGGNEHDTLAATRKPLNAVSD